MKRSINIILALVLALVLALAGILAGATAGKLLPSLGAFMSSTSASAEGLTAQPAGPLTPSPLGSGFTYQGRLLNNGSPTGGSYDFTFRLYDQSSAGTLVSGPISVTTIITNGLFTASLDFGATAFNGDARYMEIATRQTGGGSYTTLLPRQPITPAPYALYALKTKGYKNVVTVAQDGGNFTSITAALNSITDNSATNKYLVWVAPGIYTETVTMKQWVDIEGSGEKNTKITSTGNPSNNTGTVVGAGNAELRSLTAENTGGDGYAIAIYNNGVSASMSLLHVTAAASGGSEGCAVWNNSSSPSMNNVTASASGSTGYNYGVVNNSSSPSMNNVTASASGYIGVKYGVYNSSASPSMNNVTASASDGVYNYGVGNYSSSPSMNNVTAYASSGTYSIGVYNYTSSSNMNNVTVSTSGGTYNYGVYNEGTNGTNTVTINNSKITGSTNTIYNDLGTTRVGGSQLSGGNVLNFGTLSCTASYDENYVSPGLNICP